jgi:CBS domain-containing protein
MKVRDLLSVKGDKVFTITPDASLGDVVERMVENNCGSLVVCDSECPQGIITERDILRACAAKIGALEELPVRDFMSTRLVTAEPDDDVEKVMGLMTNNRVRHLPILREGRLAGMISIGDVVKAQHDQLSMENHYLKEYIQS